MATITELEKRMAAGESYLANSPGDKKARDLYNRYEAEYVALCCQAEREQSIKAVTLELPPNCQWQRHGSESVHSVVRVLFHEQPEGENEVTRAELREILADRAEALELARKERRG